MLCTMEWGVFLFFAGESFDCILTGQCCFLINQLPFGLLHVLVCADCHLTALVPFRAKFQAHLLLLRAHACLSDRHAAIIPGACG